MRIVGMMERMRLAALAETSAIRYNVGTDWIRAKRHRPLIGPLRQGKPKAGELAGDASKEPRNAVRDLLIAATMSIAAVLRYRELASLDTAR
jgi:hypothetical protein